MVNKIAAKTNFKKSWIIDTRFLFDLIIYSFLSFLKTKKKFLLTKLSI